jgi:GDPmannose 4,6-dehydratase
MKKALITGVTGQDGSYLADRLIELGYEVHGTLRYSSSPETPRIKHLIGHERFHTHYADLSRPERVIHLIEEIQPHEIYNLAAQSHVSVSFEQPSYTADVNATAVVAILETIKRLGGKARFYQASTSEIYGGIPGTEPQDETTPFEPRSPYAAAKLHAFWAVANFREAYGLFACNGILFNHESPRRSPEFVTRKITTGVAQIAAGKREKLTLGVLDTKRDWGYAPEYVEAMRMMLARDKPDDFVVATGETHSVRDFAKAAFGEAGIDLSFDGEGADEKGIDAKNGRVLVDLDPKYLRPTDVAILRGNPRKANEVLGWKATTTAKKLAAVMVKHDIASEKQT